MTQYNDGEWHDWMGRPCPVDIRSLIDHVWHDEHKSTAGITKDRVAGGAAWGQTLRFRVTKEYKEPPQPREFWLAGGRIYTTKINTPPYAIHVVEKT